MGKAPSRGRKNKEAEESTKLSKASTEDGQPRCIEAAKNGIRTGSDFANMMSCLMSDVIEGRVTPSIANATCNAGGKLLKVVEMQIKYATTTTGPKDLSLLEPSAAEAPGP